MDLTKRLSDKFQRSPLGQAAEILSFDERLRVKLKLADCDRLGCLLDRLKIEQTEGNQPTCDPVQIEAQVIYLGERLKVIESEGREGRTILRSLPPRVEGEVISYFEIVLERSRDLSLQRYMYAPKLGKRVPVPATLTRDTLERLINDLIGLVKGN